MTASFDELFDHFRESAFRLETLQHYETEGDGERLSAFRQGRPLPITPSKRAWLEFIEQAVAAGKRIYRVHVVERPLTEYVRFELLAYQENAAAGEEIRLAERDSHLALEALRSDFWLFDDTIAVPMQYDEEGHFLHFHVTTTPDVVERCQRERDLALAHSAPLHEFREGIARAS